MRSYGTDDGNDGGSDRYVPDMPLDRISNVH